MSVALSPIAGMATDFSLVNGPPGVSARYTFQAARPFSDAVVHSRSIEPPVWEAVKDARSYGAYGSGRARPSNRALPPPGRASLRSTTHASRASPQGTETRPFPAASKRTGTRTGCGPQG